MFYLLLVLESGLLVAWSLYKGIQERGFTHKRTGKSDDLELKRLTGGDSIGMTGYRKSVFGSIAYGSLGVMSVVWIVLLVVLTLDYYGVFAGFSPQDETFMVSVNS